MGTRGPMPKRADDRIRHVKKEDRPETAAAGAPIEWPESRTTWHPIARDWYESLSRSGQAVFYQQSDVAAAVYVAEAMSRSLAGKAMSGQLFASVLTGLSNLLTTEADRRRVAVELERADQAEHEAEIFAMELYKEFDR